ncbi:hypothetical protein ABPG75_000635 [Micractinium tetrahymenae]
MVQFELSDDALLKVSGVLASSLAVKLSCAPGFSHRQFFAKHETIPRNDTLFQYLGVAAGGVGITQLAVSAAEGSRPAKKNALKAAGLTWLVCAGMDYYNVGQGTLAPHYTVPAASLLAGVGALCLYRGFKKDDS